jgi:tetratricopeptide (TPR) repeat protein
MPQHLERARDLFLHAVNHLPPEQWDAYLAEACGADDELKRQAAHLLQVHRDAGSFLERPVEGLAATGALARGSQRETAILLQETVGAMIGPYKLLELIGEGGMGSVWMAQQTEPVKRLVAIKLIKAGMDSKPVIARFEAERQALALMDHPNIARVLDGGANDAGRPYFVMDLVKGVPITRYCDKHHLTPRQRLELFIPICQAIQHAHQKGIIHRDLKPSNVLVAPYDGRPVVKVIDFGVAKATGQQLTDRTLVTGFGAIVGTLEYMSPEQAQLNNHDIDTRSDIYALGVLLYELLTGATPFSRKDLAHAGMLEMLRVIREQEPSKPSTKLSTSEGLPTLAANRGTEPAKLTRLVRGELDWIVMKALEKDRNRRYETANGFAMDVQRYLDGEPVLAHTPSAGYRLRKFARRNKAILAVVALVLFFLALLGSGVGWAVRDRSAREAEAVQQQAARQEKVAGQVESIFAEVDRLEKEQKWLEALAAARRAAGAVASGDADPATAKRVRELVKDLELIDQLEQIRMLRAAWVVGDFDDVGADREYARAFRDYGVDIQALAGEASMDRLKARPTLAIILASALDDWVMVQSNLAKQDSPARNRLMAVARGIDPDPLRDRLRSLWERPESAALQDELQRIGRSIDIRAQLPATLVSLAGTLRRMNDFDAAVRLLRDAQHIYSGDFWLNFTLGNILIERKEFEGATRFNTAAVAIRPISTVALNNLGVSLYGQNKLDEAIVCYRNAIDLDPNFAFAHTNLGLALLGQKRLPEAIACCRRAIELDPKSARALTNLGYALTHKGDLEDAIAVLGRAIEINPEFAAAWSNRGVAYRKLGKLDMAVADYTKAIELNPKDVAAWKLRGIVYLHHLHQPEKAIADFSRAIELNPSIAIAWFNRGFAYTKVDQIKQAFTDFSKAIELDPKGAYAWNNRGLIFLKHLRQPEKAIADFSKAIEVKPDFAEAYVNLGNALHNKGEVDEAIKAFRKATGINPKHARAYASLGDAFLELKNLPEAVAAFGKTIELDPNNAKLHNELAWLLATSPDAKLRDPGRAVALAKKALALAPKTANYANTLGVAYYRAGDPKAAIAALEQSMELSNGGTSHDWFFLAMAHWQQGDKEQSREWYERAVEWMNKNEPKNEELRRFRAEATELLDLQERK